MISTRNLAGLPDVAGLRRLLQSMAMLDAILCPEWEYRYYSFNTRWAEGEQMGSIRNGTGDDFFALFNPAGCFLKGFAHEATMSPAGQEPEHIWPGVLDVVPPVFDRGLQEPAFRMEDTTFCLWRRFEDDSWQVGPIQWPEGPDPDGSEALLSPLDGLPETYQTWAEAYHEREVALAPIRAIYAQEPLTEALVASLNPEVTLEELEADIEEIGYPRSDTQSEGSTFAP